MQIYINDYPVEFTVENESRLSEVIKSISDWAAGRELVFSEAVVDGTFYSVEDIPDSEISTVKEINCSVRSVADIVISSIEEGIVYCGKVIDTIDPILPDGELNKTELDDLVTGAEWLREMTHKVFSLAGIDIAARYRDTSVAELLDRINVILKSGTGAAKGEPLQNLSALFTGLRQVFGSALQSDELRDLTARSIDSPETLIEELLSLKDQAMEKSELIENAVMMFQTGKDREGMAALDGVIEFIYAYNRICYQTGPVFGTELDEIKSGDLSMEQLNRNLLDHLTGLIEVMENGDIISLSDTLEYEIRPLFEEISVFIDILLKNISGETGK